ncbi:MAG: energy transducer TonB [Bacteroidales bacterium]|nr:energy transducer TonB [Bacteroidales bacterium]
MSPKKTHKKKKEKKFIELPRYPGGATAFKLFIRNNLDYPKEALREQIEGKVYVKFKVNNLGKVIDAEVRKGLGYGCDEEALRVVKKLIYEKAKNRGIRVTATMRTTINFRLPKKKPSVNITYSTPKEQAEGKKTKEKASKPVVYHYTIRIN